MALSAKELANELTNFVNNTNYKEHDDFVKELTCQHKTLQQSSLRLMLKVIEKMATKEYRTDARNEQSHIVAANLIEGFKLVGEKELRDKGVGEIGIKRTIDGEFYKPSNFLGSI
jgi:hypothetical protein